MANEEWEFLGDVSNNTTDESPDIEAPFSASDIDIEVGIEEDMAQIGDGSCIICGMPTFRPPGLTPGGNKKRVPKYCDDHDPRQKPSPKIKTTSGLDGPLIRIQEELADDLKLLGALAGALYPTTGIFILQNADPFTIALVKLAKGNERILRVLHRAAQVAPIYTVAETVAGTAIAVQVDMGKIDPHGVVAKRVGVEKAYNELHPEEAMYATPANNGFQQPPRFTTVG